MKSFVTLCGILLVCPAALLSQPPEGYSLHGEHAVLTPDSSDPEVPVKESAAKAVTPSVKNSDWVVLGYVQSNDPRWGYHWHAMTHVAIPFTGFDSNGNLTNASSTITNRSIMYQPGGIADRNGVKVLMTIINSGFNTATLDSVMQNSARRTSLATQVAAFVNNPNDNIAGVNLDFEPVPYSAGTGQGIVNFIVELRGLLNPGKGISYYVGPTYHASSYPNLATAAANLDFVNVSCYPYSGSWSSTSRSITPLSGYMNNVDSFMANGVPPEKMVLTLGNYGYRMETSGAQYGASKIANIGSIGFADAKYLTTTAPARRTRQYQLGVESPFYAWPTGGTFEHVVYEDEFSLELKMRNAQSWVGNVNTGAKLRGVGYWSLAWMGRNFLGSYNSRDLETNSSTNKIRTYPHIYQQMQEIFAPPGEKEYVLENWEYFSASISAAQQSQWDRWRNPSEGPDNLGVVSATRSIIAVPSGVGRPQNSDYCARLAFNFSATANNRFFYRWEILGDASDTTTRDFNATRGFFRRTSKVSLDLHTPAAYPGRTVSMIFLDGNGQLEKGPSFSLNSSGWRSITTDVANASFTGYNTNFNQYFDGNGVINTAGDGARDIAFIGLLVEGGGAAGSGQIDIDQLRHSHSNVGGLNYKINEFAYRSNSGEFVELYGPQGTIPAGVELRVYTAEDGELIKTISLSGISIPSNGIFAIGDPAVAGVATSVGFSNGADDLPNTMATGLQLYNSVTGGVYDSVVYRAYDGIGMLTRPETHGVSAEGYPWLGEIATGPYSYSRYPDGTDQNFNYIDFASLPSTPGVPNGAGLPSLPVSFNFDGTQPGSAAFLAYSWVNAGVRAPGVTPSPNGGSVYRVADTSGGNIAYFPSPIARGEEGYRVRGQIYIPAAAEAAQALGVGICATLGSTFFPTVTGSSSYENGYWLIYNNNASVNLNHGLGNHSQSFKFVMAQNNNMSRNPVIELGSATVGTAGITPGAWTHFMLEIDPEENKLRAEINGVSVYDGPIPEGGRRSGSFVAGHRKQTGSTAASEGLWLDLLSFELPGKGAALWQITSLE